MNKPYIQKIDKFIIIDLVTSLAIINDDEPDKITIYDLKTPLANVTLTKAEVLKISKFIKNDKDYCNKLETANNITINQEWVVIGNCNYQISIRPEMFNVIVEFIESEEIRMNESNSTQNIYNKIINLSTNNPTEKIEKPINSVGKMTIKKSSIYDSILNTINTDTKGVNNNDNKQQ